MSWKITTEKKINAKNPILIEGMPGIGNVGKIAVDVLIEETKAVKVMDFFSHELPNSVFVNEENLVELPKIEMYHKRFKTQDFLFLTGDVQPQSETASFEFCEKILDVVEEFKCKRIITLGGIGLNEIPSKPRVYVTGTSIDYIKEFKAKGAHDKVFGVVGPIIGVTGLLLGLGEKRGMKAVALLSETFSHPLYVGLRSAREILKVLSKKYLFKINFKELDKEIKQIDELTIHSPEEIAKTPQVKKFQKYRELNYIG